MNKLAPLVDEKPRLIPVLLLLALIFGEYVQGESDPVSGWGNEPARSAGLTG